MVDQGVGLRRHRWCAPKARSIVPGLGVWPDIDLGASSGTEAGGKGFRTFPAGAGRDPRLERRQIARQTRPR